MSKIRDQLRRNQRTGKASYCLIHKSVFSLFESNLGTLEIIKSRSIGGLLIKYRSNPNNRVNQETGKDRQLELKTTRQRRTPDATHGKTLGFKHT